MAPSMSIDPALVMAKSGRVASVALGMESDAREAVAADFSSTLGMRNLAPDVGILPQAVVPLPPKRMMPPPRHSQNLFLVSASMLAAAQKVPVPVMVAGQNSQLPLAASSTQTPGRKKLAPP